MLYNLAFCYEQLGNWAGCQENYSKYLTSYRGEHSGADPAERHERGTAALAAQLEKNERLREEWHTARGSWAACCWRGIA